jgi:hypothetical protein
VQERGEFQQRQTIMIVDPNHSGPAADLKIPRGPSRDRILNVCYFWAIEKTRSSFRVGGLCK